MNKKKKLLISGIIIAVLAVIAVVISVYIGNLQNEKKMDELYAAALDYYNSGDYDHAIESYEQILQIEDVDLVHTKIEELKDEKEKVAVITDLFKGFKRINEEVEFAVTPSEIRQLLGNIKEQTERFNELETGSDSEIDQFIDVLKNRATYQFYLKDYLSGDVIQDTSEGIILSSERYLVKSMTDDFVRDMKLPPNVVLE